MSTSGADTVHCADPVFARAVAKALGALDRVLALGARSTSYVPAGSDVTVVEPTSTPLPFADDSFDAAIAAFTVQEPPGSPDSLDSPASLAEVLRVTTGPVVVLTRDPDRIRQHWLAEFAADVTAADAARHPTLDRLREALGDGVTTTRLPTPFTCAEPFAEAYYARPERLFDAEVRRADPAWALVDEMTARRSVAALRTALDSGAWDARHGALRVQPAYDGSVVLLTAQPRLES